MTSAPEPATEMSMEELEDIIVSHGVDPSDIFMHYAQCTWLLLPLRYSPVLRSYTKYLLEARGTSRVLVQTWPSDKFKTLAMNGMGLNEEDCELLSNLMGSMLESRP